MVMLVRSKNREAQTTFQADMVRLPGGTFRMGSDKHYPEETPVHSAIVDGFWMDRTPVTNREFRKFVEATGYVTFAEIPPDPLDYPDALPHMLKAGSLVFSAPDQPVDLGNFTNWWSFQFGANWRRPFGKGSSIRGLDNHPVVHVAYQDAEAYATWAGKELPTEAEWEYAARGGLDQAEFAWGDELTPGGRHMANTWQGAFPQENLASDGYERTSPVDAFPPNGFGLSDLIGNVWEWLFAKRRAVVDEALAAPRCSGRSPLSLSDLGRGFRTLLTAAVRAQHIATIAGNLHAAIAIGAEPAFAIERTNPPRPGADRIERIEAGELHIEPGPGIVIE
jgi:formylglycine-generating enzyme